MIFLLISYYVDWPPLSTPPFCRDVIIHGSRDQPRDSGYAATILRYTFLRFEQSHTFGLTKYGGELMAFLIHCVPLHLQILNTKTSMEENIKQLADHVTASLSACCKWRQFNNYKARTPTGVDDECGKLEDFRDVYVLLFFHCSR